MHYFLHQKQTLSAKSSKQIFIYLFDRLLIGLSFTVCTRTYNKNGAGVPPSTPCTSCGFFKNGPFPASFFLIFVFSIHS